MLVLADGIEFPEAERGCGIEIFDVLSHGMLIKRLEQEDIRTFFLYNIVGLLIQRNTFVIVHFHTGLLDKSGCHIIIINVSPAQLFCLVIGEKTKNELS